MKITLPNRKLEKGGIFHVELFSVFLVFWDFFNSILRHQKVQRSQINSFWIFFKEKWSICLFFQTFSPETHKICNQHFFRNKLKFRKIISFEKKNSVKKFQKHMFSWKENFLNIVPKKIFFRKKFTEKNSFRKHFIVKFFTNSILQKNFTKIFLKNWRKKFLKFSFQFLKN